MDTYTFQLLGSVRLVLEALHLGPLGASLHFLRRWHQDTRELCMRLSFSFVHQPQETWRVGWARPHRDFVSHGGERGGVRGVRESEDLFGEARGSSV